jgi:small nuclear ribonucleoprotein D3
MNIIKLNSTVTTARDGRVSRLENVYLRGGNIKFIVLPELLKSAPIFKKVQVMRNKKVGDMDLNGGRGGRGDGGRGRGRGREAGRGGGRGRN